MIYFYSWFFSKFLFFYKLYNISGAWRDVAKEKTLIGIRDILGKPQIGKEKVGHVYDLFASAYGIKDRKPKAFKEALKPLFYNVEIIDTTKDKKHIRGITVTLDRGDEFFEQLISFLTESQKENEKTKKLEVVPNME